MNNTFLYISLILFSISLAYYQNQLPKIAAFFIIYFIIFLIIEFLDIYVGINLWSQSERTTECYNWFEHYFKNDYGIVDGKPGFDYSESIYYDDYTISSEQALKNKYELIFNELQLSEGKTLLDCGCGIGTWLAYCQSRGVIVTGMTLSKEQQIVATEKGVKVYVHDYRVFDKKFVNQFDAISLLGSTEHITVFCGFKNTEHNSYNSYSDLFKVVRQYLKQDGKILLTVLVQGRPMKDRSGVYDRIQGYIMQRHYGGYYPKPDVIRNAIIDNGFKITSSKDYTKDYHWISVVEPDHFGHWWIHWEEDTTDKILYIFKGIVTDPFLIHRWLYYGMDTWMWQFGGYQNTPLTDEQVEKAIANLKYFSISKN